MKRLLLILALLAPCLVKADSTYVTALVTVTNSATNGFTFSINGVLRTWTNSVTSVSTQILAGTNIVSSASNLFNAYAAYPQVSVLISKTASNQVSFQSYPSTAMVVAFGGAYATVSYSTNTITQATVVRVPVSIAGITERSSILQGLIGYLNLSGNGGVTINPTAPAWVNFASSSNSYAGVVRLASNVSSVTISGLALPFTPTVAFAHIGVTNAGYSLVANVKQGSLTSNGATFYLNGFTDSTNYFLNYQFPK